jgi:hypothetical protein
MCARRAILINCRLLWDFPEVPALINCWLLWDFPEVPALINCWLLWDFPEVPVLTNSSIKSKARVGEEKCAGHSYLIL